MRPRCTVLDLACGYGRHSRFFASLGHPVCAVDCDPDALASLSGQRRIHVLRVDLEGGAWPFAGQRFGGIVVTNYLHRPLLSKIVSALTDDGVLIYETFARGNERYGKPSNPAFLLEPGELLEAVHDRLRVVAFEDVFVDLPKPAMIQRICACGLHHAPAPQPE
ncbi:MAG: class I SAM-dependent methyltransferase [Burkholderiales bacterium]